MRKTAWQIALLAVILFIVCAVCRLAMRNTYVAYVHIPYNLSDMAMEDMRIIPETPGVVSYGRPQRVGDNIRVSFQPRQPGDTWLSFAAGAGNPFALDQLRVSRFGTIYDTATGGFTGDSIALAAFTVYCFAVAWIMFRAYRRSKGPAFYAYGTIYEVGLGLFALLTGLYMLVVTLRHALRPEDFIMLNAYEAISNSGFRFMMLTSPFVLSFAVAMAVSNVALLRHEPFALKNVLGIGVALVLVAGEALAFYLYTRDFVGSEWEWRVHNSLQNVYATCFTYFECVLVGAIICGVKAAKHVPAQDADYILILGCRFFKDGSLTPLLRGRVDRAIEFWQAQREGTGKEAVLMPSGGQGPGEVMAEAEAMRLYLLERGIPDSAIRIEDRSRNTYQNMKYSRLLIDSEKPGAKVAFATTNYHVFRSGVWASRAGLRAEGMGSHTKWWYWPNAFMRECVGLLMNRIPQELLVLVAMVVFFGAMSMALS